MAKIKLVYKPKKPVTRSLTIVNGRLVIVEKGVPQPFNERANRNDPLKKRRVPVEHNGRDIRFTLY